MVRAHDRVLAASSVAASLPALSQGYKRPGPRSLTRWAVLSSLLALPALAAANRAPVVHDVEVSGTEDQEARGSIGAVDPDANALNHRLKKRARHGEVTLDAATGAFSYQPEKNFNGDDAFSVDVSDGKLKATSQVTVHLAAVNDAPVTAPVKLSGAEDAVVRGVVKATDVDGDAITWRVSVPPGHGEATVDARTGVISYRGAPNYNGADAFTVEASDGALTANAEVTVSLAPVNDAPVAQAATFSFDEDTRFAGTVVATDVDADPLKYTLAVRPKHGEATVDAATGALSFTPVLNYNGDNALTVEVSDGKLKSTAKVSLRILSVNDAPVVAPAAISTNEDTPGVGTLVASDVDGENLSYKISKPPAHGEATVDAWTGALAYRPAPNFNGPDAFAVEVSDGKLSAEAAVGVTVASVNDAPNALSAALTLDEDTRLEGMLGARDVDGDPLTWKLGKKTRHGTLELNPATGAFTYQPAPDFHGSDGFTFEVSDGHLKSQVAVVSLEVRPVNDAPVTAPLAISTHEDVAVQAVVAASDIDGDALTWKLSSPAAHGQATVDPRTGALSYRPAPDYNGSDAFVIEVSDGTVSAISPVSVAISAVYDPPVVRPATFETQEDTLAEGKLPGSDPDGTALTFHLLSAPRLGKAELTDASTGAWRFTPGADLNGDDTLAFDVSDGTTTVKGTVKLHVAPVNDRPLLANLELATIEDRGVDGLLIGSDVDGDALTYSTLTQPKQGKCAIVDAAKGTFRFEPARDQNGPASCTVSVTDGKLASAAATVTIQIEPQNDAPVATNASLKTDEDEVLTGKVSGTDVDRDPLSYAVVRPPAHGTLKLVETGAFTYVPAPDYFGADSFSFSATDPSKASGEGLVQLTISPVNDAPVANADVISAPSRGSVTGRLHGFDRENQRLTFKIVGQPSSGHVKLVDERTGDFVLTTDGAHGDLRFEFVVSDGQLTSDPAQWVVQINNM